jgi:hypothetical protein
MKNAVFWDVEPYRSCVDRRFGETYCLHLQGRKIRERGISVSRWLQSAATSVVGKHGINMTVTSLESILMFSFNFTDSVIR